MRTLLALIAAPLLLGGCTTPPPPAQDGIARAGLNQRVYVDGPQATPLAVLEDSRCPVDVQCVWAGRVRLAIRVHLGSGDRDMEITSGVSLPVADGTLELVEVTPARRSGADIRPADYRFGFRFMGGL